MEENLRQLFVHLAEVEQFSRTKTYRNALGEIDQLFIKAIGAFEKAAHMTICIISGKEITRLEEQDEKRTQRRVAMLKTAQKEVDENPRFATRKSGRKRKKGKKQEKGETYKITFSLLKEGMDIKEIASKRGMAVSTIEGHLCKGIRAGEVRILDLISEDVVDEIAEKLNESKTSLGEVHNAFNGKFSYGVLRMVQAHLGPGGL